MGGDKCFLRAANTTELAVIPPYVLENYWSVLLDLFHFSIESLSLSLDLLAGDKGIAPPQLRVEKERIAH